MTGRNIQKSDEINFVAAEYIAAGFMICVLIVAIANQGAVATFLRRWAVWAANTLA